MPAVAPGVQYIGTLRAAGGGGSAHPVAPGRIVPQLIACSQLERPRSRPAASTAAEPLSSALLAPADSAGAARKRRVPQKKAYNYYVCTLAGCGWRGASIRVHNQARPNCPGYPCHLTYLPGQKPAQEADKFVARCTPRQRELGLPPDYAKPVPLPDASGHVDLGVRALALSRSPSRSPSRSSLGGSAYRRRRNEHAARSPRPPRAPHPWIQVLYLTVPVGLVEGDRFEIPTGSGFLATVTVPEGKSEGDLLSIYPRVGKRKEPSGGAAAHGAEQADDDNDEDDAFRHLETQRLGRGVEANLARR